MSAPFLWIGIPAISSIILFGLRKRMTPVLITGGLISLLMAWLAWQFPIDAAVSIGPISVKVTETMSVFGRGFSLTDAQRPFLAFLFISSACWYFGAIIAYPGEFFGPATMAILSLLIAAVAVEPFLYAALLIELAVLICIPLLAPPWKLARRGVFRFLSFQTFGMPFILFTGWMLTGVSASPSNVGMVVTASIFLGLGFAFLLGVFPFHSWIPMITEQSHPYAAGLLLYFFPGIISIFALGFLDRFVWLREDPSVFLMIQWVGTIMVFFGGLWAAFQTHLGKIFGFAAMMEIGLTLVSIGLGTPDGLDLYFAMWVPRLVVYIIWAISLATISRQNDGDLSYNRAAGFGLASPYILLTLMISNLSLVGAPALAGYPLRIALWQSTASISQLRALILLLGAGGLLVAVFRTISVMLSYPENTMKSKMLEFKEHLALDHDRENLSELLFFVFSMIVLLLIGWFPQWWYSFLSAFPGMFELLGL